MMKTDDWMFFSICFLMGTYFLFTDSEFNMFTFLYWMTLGAVVWMIPRAIVIRLTRKERIEPQ